MSEFFDCPDRKLKAFCRRTKRVLCLSVLLMAFWVTFATANILFPSPGTKDTPNTDVVVSLAPGWNRLPKALELYNQGNFRNLAVSWFPDEYYSANSANSPLGHLESSICGVDKGSRTYCFTPNENSTAGEARYVVRLAEKHDWHTITVVTSQYHVFRTRFIFGQVAPPHIAVNVVAAPTELPTRQWVRHVIYENLALIKAAWNTVIK